MKGTRTKRSLLILTHAAWEQPALLDVALELGLNNHDVEVHRLSVVSEVRPTLPRVEELAGLIVMGGPQDANDDVRHPGLPSERRILAEATERDIPVIGVCLGMQLLALALGAKIHLQNGAEIGLASVDYTTAATRDPVLGPIANAKTEFGQSAPVLHWHYDAVELPPGATLLASSDRTPVQAFRLGSALGTQFHPEADEILLDSWLEQPRMVGNFAPEEIAALKRDGARHFPRLRQPALQGFEAFVNAVNARV